MVDAEVDRVEIEQGEGDDNYIPVIEAVKSVPILYDRHDRQCTTSGTGIMRVSQLVHPDKLPLFLKLIEWRAHEANLNNIFVERQN